MFPQKVSMECTSLRWKFNPKIHQKKFAERLNPYPAFCEPLTGSDNSYLTQQQTEKLHNGISSNHQGFLIRDFLWVFLLRLQKRCTGSVSDSETFLFPSKGYIPINMGSYAPPKKASKTELLRRICHKWLVQPGSNFSICSVIFLRFVEDCCASWWSASFSEYPTRRLLHLTDPNSFEKPETISGFYTRTALPSFLKLLIFLADVAYEKFIPFLTSADRTQKMLSFGKLFSMFKKSMCFLSSGNN